MDEAREDQAATIIFQVAPLNLTRREALRYTGWAPKLFNALERAGSIIGLPHGPNGKKIYSRAELEAADRQRRGEASALDIDAEFAALDARAHAAEVRDEERRFFAERDRRRREGAKPKR